MQNRMGIVLVSLMRLILDNVQGACWITGMSHRCIIMML